MCQENQVSERFSSRRGLVPQANEIKVRNDAPADLRYAVVAIVYDLGLLPSWLRHVVCNALRTRPDPGNWTEHPNIDDEVRWLLDKCEWYRVYDIVEAIGENLHGPGTGCSDRHERFVDDINGVFREQGIGWQLVHGRIEVRGEEEFETSVHTAGELLEESGRRTARREIREAIGDLSRRPDPDVTGAIHHAMAALECFAREVCGEPKATLGELLKRRPDLLPRPLGKGIEGAWGYASEMARHIREGREPSFAEAEFMVGLCASSITYLARKLDAAD